MKKRVIALVCTLVIAFGVCAAVLIPDVSAETSTYQVGFSRVDINPWVDVNDHSKGLLALPLRGHGNTKYRRSASTLIDDNGDGVISTDGSDGLFASCIAVTDSDGDTVIIMSVAIIGGFDMMVDDARAGIVAQLKEEGIDIPAENIMIQGTHTHSSVDLAVYTSGLANDTTSYYLLDENGDKIDDESQNMTGAQIYANFEIWYPYLISQLTKCGVEAATNQSAATMSKSEIDAGDAAGKVMNTVRHYTRVTNNGEVYVTGSNFNSDNIAQNKSGDGTMTVNSSGSAELAEANDTMYCLKFEFTDGKTTPIALVNWRAHTTMNDRDGTGNRISSCYVNRMSQVLLDGGYNSVFIQGAAGNINPSSSIYGSWCGSSHHKDDNGDGLWLGNELTGNIYGEVLGQVALKCLENTNTTNTACDAGDIQVTSMEFNADDKSYEEAVMYWAGKSVNTLYNLGVKGHLVSGNLKYPFIYPQAMFSSFETSDTLNSAYTAAFTTAVEKNYLTQKQVDELVEKAKEMRTAYLSGEVDSYIVASRFHASDIIDNYLDTGTNAIELSAFVLGESVAFVTAPGEMYDRYNSNITWDELKDLTQADIYNILSSVNEWDKLIDESSYGTPFVMGYANSHIGYMPNYLAYEYSKDSTFAAVGSYEAHCAEQKQGENEHILDVFKAMLDSLVDGVAEDNELYKYGYCQACEKTVVWEPWSARYNATSMTNGGHFHAVADTDCAQNVYETAVTTCLDLDGKSLTGATRFLNLNNAAGATFNIQDSVGGGVVIGQGTTSPTTGFGGGTLFVGGGNTLNIYGGTFEQITEGGHYVKYGGVLFTRGTVNMYDGTFKGGQAWNKGATVDVVADSNGTGIFNIYGGTVENGSEQVRYYDDGTTYASAFTTGTCVNGGSTASLINLSGDANVADIYAKSAANIKVTGQYSGTAQLTYKTTPTAGGVLGASDNAVINTTGLTVSGTDYVAVVSGSNIVAGSTATCACGETVVINELTQDLWDAYEGALPSAHYKLAENIDAAVAATGVETSNTVCLDLNGNSISVTTGRLYKLLEGAAFRICDSSENETGSIITAGLPTTIAKDSRYGGLFWVSSGATLELSSGTLTMELGEGMCVQRGGIVHIEGTFDMSGGTVKDGICNGTETACFGGNISIFGGGVMNMSGGTVKDGTSNNGTTSENAGGNIQIFKDGTLNASGGSITGGTAKSASVGNCVRQSSGGKLVLSGDAYVEETSLRVGDVTVSGTYTGTVKLRIASTTPTSGLVIGVSDNANIDNANITIYNSALDVYVAGSSLVLAQETTCSACGETVAFMPVSCLTSNTWQSGHYFVDQEELTYESYISIPAGEGVCLDLHGNTMTATKSRLFNVYGTMHILDSVGQGVAQGIAGDLDKGYGGGTAYVYADASLYLHSGTLTQVIAENKESSKGGVVLTKGNFYMVGGTITGGTAYRTNGTGYGGNICVDGGSTYIRGGTISNGSANGTSGGYGGNIHVISGTLYLQGGTITGGSASAAARGNCVSVASAGYLVLSDSGSADEIRFGGTDSLTVSGTYTGTTALRLASTVALEAGTVIGTSDGGNISRANITVVGSALTVKASGSDLVLFDTAGGAIIKDAEGNEVTFESVGEAIEEYQGTDETLVLMGDVNESGLTISKDMTIDLNGSTIEQEITIADGVTLTCMDSQTDDYDVTDGTFTQIPASMAGNAVAAQGYLKYTHDDDNTVSFHKIETAVESLSVRPSKVGMYYGGTFKGDQYVAEQVKTFGVALSITEAPVAGTDGFPSHCLYSAFTSDLFEPGNTEEYTSTILVDILSENNGTITNKKNGATNVYGVSYIQLNDGTYIYGNQVSYSLQWAMEWTNKNWSSLSKETQQAVFEMYEKYPAVIKAWDTDTITDAYEAAKEAQEEKSLKVLVLGNSHALDTTNLLMEVFETEGMGQYDEVVLGAMYRSGCRMDQHSAFAAANTAAYSYYKNVSNDGKDTWDVTKNCTLLTALKDEQWDIVVLQEMNVTAGQSSEFADGDIANVINYVCQKLGYRPELKWHLVWANPEIPSTEGDGYSYYKYTSEMKNAYIAALEGDSAEADGSENEDASTSTSSTTPWIYKYASPTDRTIGGVTYPGSLKWEHNYQIMYGGSRNTMYQMMVNNVRNYVNGNATYGIGEDDVIAAGTAVQYAIETLGLTEQDLYRDYTHMNDYGRVMTAYLWYAELLGLDSISEVNYTTVAANMRQSKFQSQGNLVLNTEQIQAIIEAVNYTLEKTYGEY